MMDLIAVLYGAMKCMLFMVMIFGAYLVSRQMHKGKIRNLLVVYLLFWALLLSLDIYNVISIMATGTAIPFSPILLTLVSVLSSQIVMLWFFYNMLFTFKRSLKIMAVHLAVMAVVLSVTMGVYDVDISQFFYVADTLELAYKDVSAQTMFFKALVVIMQLLMTAAALFVSNRIIPIYQRYIEQNESNAAYNLLWIKEVGRIVFLATTAYTYLMVFTTYINAVIYYLVLVLAYMRMINTLMQNVTLENFDELYEKLGVKWSWRRMWYVEEVTSPKKGKVKSQFDMIIEWITSDRPYVNPQFSFKDVTAHFDGVTFNDFDALIRDGGGHNFQAYIRECRINYATELMSGEDNQLLLKEVAFRVGFDSSTAFSRAFKAVKGVAASEWKAKM